MKKEEKENILNEPTAEYQKRLVFFKSFEEEQQAQIDYWRSLTHEQRLEQHRIISLYAFSSFEKYTGNRLKFD
ncbi:MAG: hypothetical protein NTY88_13490 [Bacteroidetes bacterium]|nr:hypothetical protein [Bacteroidota bacterium]